MGNERIAINDLARHIKAVEEPVREAIDRVVDSGQLILGPECRGFERAFAAYCGSAYCVGVANGTDALEIALRSLDLGPGHRIATVANAGFYAACAIRQVGANPVFVDVDPESRLMSLPDLTRLAEDRAIEAVILTHLYGLMHDAAAVRAIADRYQIRLIEDCAQAHGARRSGRCAGSFGDLSCFSFYPTKNLGALGDGGAIITDDETLAQRAARLRQYGWNGKYSVAEAGGRNSRLDEIQAAVLLAKLPLLDGWNARRRQIATLYTEGVDHPAVNCPSIGGDEFVAHLYVVECDARDDLRAYLAEQGIACDVHYPIPDHRQAVLHQAVPTSLPTTERLAARILTLPCFPELRIDEVSRVVGAVNAWRPPN